MCLSDAVSECVAQSVPCGDTVPLAIGGETDG